MKNSASSTDGENSSDTGPGTVGGEVRTLDIVVATMHVDTATLAYPSPSCYDGMRGDTTSSIGQWAEQERSAIEVCVLLGPCGWLPSPHA
jgi:hypothetical protein